MLCAIWGCRRVIEHRLICLTALTRTSEAAVMRLQGISADLDDGYDPGASAEEARRQRQRDLEIEAEMRVRSSQLCKTTLS